MHLSGHRLVQHWKKLTMWKWCDFSRNVYTCNPGKKKNTFTFMKPEGSLLYSHKHYAEPLEFSQHFHGLHASTSIISTLILHLHIPLKSDPFFLRFATTIFYSVHIQHADYMSHSSYSLQFNSLTTFNKVHKLWSLSMCHFLHLPATSLSYVHIHISTLLIYVWLLAWDQVSCICKTTITF